MWDAASTSAGTDAGGSISFYNESFRLSTGKGSVSGDSWPAIEVCFRAVLRIVSSPDVDTLCAFLRRFAVTAQGTVPT